MSLPQKTSPESEEVLKLLREIEQTSETTQRELSSRLGISLGKINFLLKSLIDKGHIKVDNFKKSNNKSAYLYYLTPKGAEEKAKITYRFLWRKMQEYENLEQEIQRLKHEVSKAPVQQEK
ncbi:MAG: MarR family EPS-associated transcriptional regulator [Deltaproteobacteria bacterium HGW-Deltaproteobacteria-9]|nr:MAG: MarR family EPS-associated transcriptional regulator [Deltaproteobacteria bacterium HGW-Deltaproteobacteria-9]